MRGSIATSASPLIKAACSSSGESSTFIASGRSPTRGGFSSQLATATTEGPRSTATRKASLWKASPVEEAEERGMNECRKAIAAPIRSSSKNPMNPFCEVKKRVPIYKSLGSSHGAR